MSLHEHPGNPKGADCRNCGNPVPMIDRNCPICGFPSAHYSGLTQLKRVPFIWLVIAWVVLMTIIVAIPLIKQRNDRSEMGLFNKKEKAQDKRFSMMRSNFYGLNAADLQLSREKVGADVWGVVAEWNWGADLMLFALADGTVSLYTSSGFMVIGAGEHDSVRKVAREVLSGGSEALARSHSKTAHDLPPQGTVRFTFLTFDGPRFMDESERALTEGSSPLSDYFRRFQLLMGEIRKIAEEPRNG